MKKPYIRVYILGSFTRWPVVERTAALAPCWDVHLFWSVFRIWPGGDPRRRSK